MAGSPRAAPHDTDKRLQHTQRHPVTAAAAARAAAAFGNSSEAAATAVCLLRQPKLRQVFEHVFECTTASGNNQWMRGKLLQALGFSSRWQPTPEQQERQQQAQMAGITAHPSGVVCPAREPKLVDSSEDSVQTLGQGGTWPPPTPRSKRAAPAPGNSPSPKRRAASLAGSPRPVATTTATTAAAPPSSQAPHAAAGSSNEGQQQQRTLTPAWQQAAVPFGDMAAGSLTVQDALLWQTPSLQQLLSLQHSTGSSSSVEAAVQAALRRLGWGGLHDTAGLGAAPTRGPAAYQLLGLHGADLAFVWEPQMEAQHPAWWAQMGACPPPPLNFWAQQVAGGAAPDPGQLAQQQARLTQQQVRLAQQQAQLAQQQAAQAQLAQQQAAQAQQRFAFGLPTAALDQLPGETPVADLAFTPALLSHPPPLPQHWQANRRAVGSASAAVAQPQQPPTAGAAAAAAVAPPAAARSISFSLPSSLAQRSPFVAPATTLPPAAGGTAAAPAPTPMRSPPPALPAAAAQPPAQDAAGACQDVRAMLSLSEDAPLNDDLLCMFLSWNDASLHL